MAARGPVRCVCGRIFKNPTGHRHHAQVCPLESRRSAMFVAACETGDWSTYEAEWKLLAAASRLPA